MKTAALLLLTVFCLMGCEIFSPEKEEYAVARVGDTFLYEYELENLNLKDNSKDSAEVVQNYIDSWIKEQLILQKAMQNLSAEQLDFETQLENYKNSLMIFAYENLLVKQKLDTTVSMEEVLAYYQDNPQNFKLKEQLIKGQFVQIINSAPLQDSLVEWMFSAESGHEFKLNDYCTQFAMRCQLDTSLWIPFSKIKALLPMDISLESLQIYPGKNVISDTVQTLILDVIDQRFPGDAAPVTYVDEQIKSIIRNRRKIQLLAKVREEIFEDATIKKKYEIYN